MMKILKLVRRNNNKRKEEEEDGLADRANKLN
jgi:hypothetical protein